MQMLTGAPNRPWCGAGVMRENKLSEATEDDFDYLFNNNTKGLFFGLQTVANAMRDAGTKGSIVAISSVMGHEVRVTVNMTKSIYGATKAANDILMKYAAGEYAEHGAPCLACLAPSHRTGACGLSSNSPFS